MLRERRERVWEWRRALSPFDTLSRLVDRVERRVNPKRGGVQSFQHLSDVLLQTRRLVVDVRVPFSAFETLLPDCFCNGEEKR